MNRNEIHLFERGEGIEEGDEFVAHIDSVEGHRRVTLIRKETPLCTWCGEEFNEEPHYDCEAEKKQVQAQEARGDMEMMQEPDYYDERSADLETAHQKLTKYYELLTGKKLDFDADSPDSDFYKSKGARTHTPNLGNVNTDFINMVEQEERQNALLDDDLEMQADLTYDGDPELD